MHTSRLRKVGGSVMVALPPALLDMLELRPGATVGMAVNNGQLVIDPHPRPRYTLSELLAECDPEAEASDEDRQWDRAAPVGNELL